MLILQDKEKEAQGPLNMHAHVQNLQFFKNKFRQSSLTRSYA